MPWQGFAPNKTFVRSNGTHSGATTWAEDEAAGTGITTARHDTHDEDLADGLNAALAKNGDNKMTGAIDAGGFGFTNLATLGSATEAAIASSTTTNLLGSSALFNEITGTTTITSLGSGASRVKVARFSGALTLTHNATSLILPGGANITTAAGDTMIVVSDASSNARVVSYQRAAVMLPAAGAQPLSAYLTTLAGLGKTLIGFKVWTASDTYTPTTGMTTALLGTLGGGGGGGGCANSAAGTQAYAGGGGAGSLSLKLVTAADIGASKAVTIGAGGGGASAGNNTGTAGGDTSIGTLCVGKGGAGGGGTASAQQGAGGAGGVAGTGDVAGTGQPGLGGIGGGAVTAPFGRSGAGGSTFLGGGAQGNRDHGAGAAAGGYGAGGSGGASRNDNGTTGGGAGTDGIAFALEYA